jgi:hypothetical protein
MNPTSDELEEESAEEEKGSPLGRVGFALTDGDLDIFKLLYEYRMLRREHISALTGRPPRRLHRRLLKLIAEGYTTSIRLPQQKHIYALGKEALPILVAQGIASDELLTERLRVHELKELFLRHEMMIVDFHVMLSLAGKTDALKLVGWREGRELYDWVTVADHAGVNKLPVRPDAFFTLEDSRRQPGANRANFFLEADRSTATQTRFKDKIRAYWHYLEQGLHAKKFGIKNYRVLTLTLTHARARNLCELAAAVLPERGRKYYLFTSVGNFSLENPAPILGSVYLSPRNCGGGGSYPLVAPPSMPPSETTVVI